MNIKLLVNTIIVVLLTSLLARPVMAEPVVIELQELQSDNGQIIVHVYNNKKQWMSDDKKDIFLEYIQPIDGFTKGAPFTFQLDLPKGDYALYLFQDLDENGEMKTNWIGIPKEPVGTSNNAKGSMGPPKYKDALFNHTAATKLSIKINNID